jgi:hypothetical protein
MIMEVRRSTDSCYLADLLRRVRLELSDQDGARKAYAQALENIECLAEQNLWVEATAATTVVTGDETKALRAYGVRRRYNLSRRSWKRSSEGSAASRHSVLERMPSPSCSRRCGHDHKPITGIG